MVKLTAKWPDRDGNAMGEFKLEGAGDFAADGSVIEVDFHWEANCIPHLKVVVYENDGGTDTDDRVVTHGIPIQPGEIELDIADQEVEIEERAGGTIDKEAGW